MEATVKKQTAFRFDSELLDLLKSAAKREHRSLNNYVECLLTKDCIKENQIIYERRKVNKKATPFLTDKARIIINKYKDEALGDYVFSMNVNKTLKKVREKLKIKDEITWYSARGTFISKMIDEGFHPMQVAQFAGNSPDMIYRHYYKNTDPKSTLESLNRIF